MKLIHVISGVFSCLTILRYPSPDLILNHQHAQLFQLFTELLDVIADQTVINVDVGPVVKEI